MTPTWTSLAPVVRGSVVDEDATWAVLEAHHDFVLGAVRRVVPRAEDVVALYDGHADAAVAEVYQWLVLRLVKRVHGEPPGLPVTPRDDGTPGSAAKWFFTVVANLARDWLKSERRRMRRETEVPENADSGSVAPDAALWDDAALRKLQRLLQHPDRSGVPDTHVLAYVALYRPEALDRASVVRAAAYVPSAGSRSGRPGLLRTVDDTWAYLLLWRSKHGNDPFTTEARVELAWILRGDDDGPPETWAHRDGRAARTATVTVGKWAIRCADVLTLPRK